MKGFLFVKVGSSGPDYSVSAETQPTPQYSVPAEQQYTPQYSVPSEQQYTPPVTSTTPLAPETPQTGLSNEQTYPQTQLYQPVAPHGTSKKIIGYYGEILSMIFLMFWSRFVLTTFQLYTKLDGNGMIEKSLLTPKIWILEKYKE